MIPLLEMYPNSIVIANDLSIELLYLLKKNAFKLDIDNNLVLLQLNAEELNFKDNSFDLIMGSGVLHHLFALEKTLKQYLKILKTGGHAVFYEPFENGNSIMGCIYRNILNDSRKDSLPTDSVDFFTSLSDSFDFCKGEINQIQHMI